MPTLIRDYDDGGLVNVDRAAWLAPLGQDRAGVRRYRAMADNGEGIGTIAASDLDHPGQVIPDTRQTIVVRFWLDVERDTVAVERLPVIAWKVTEGIAEPLTVEELDGASNTVWCLELSTGAWVYPGESYHETLESAATEAAHRLRAEATRRQRPEQAATA